jgi:hypothetical protein
VNHNFAAVVHNNNFLAHKCFKNCRVNAARNSAAWHMANGQVVQVHIYEINEKTDTLTQKTNISNRFRHLNKPC